VDKTTFWEKPVDRARKPRVRPRIIMDSVHPGEPHITRPGDPHAGPSGVNRMPPAPGWGRRIFWFLFVLVIAACCWAAPPITNTR
jgi:hypothetical protein